ncbi:centromere protein O isoform X2 [Heptranchias perlo]|uniref:centromere protein O isoform X2 n=1 Tax=Heptranchias perlo TaxID=212740 RepID=UPI0035596BEC
MATQLNSGVLEHLKKLEACAKELASEQVEAQQKQQPISDILAQTRKVSTLQLDQEDVISTVLKRKFESLQNILEAYHFTGISSEVKKPGSVFCFCISTAYEGTYLDSYYLDIQVQHPRKIIRHNIPVFIPLDQMAQTYLEKDLQRFMGVLNNDLNAYVSRRYQAEQLQECHAAYLTSQVQKNAAYNLLKFNYPIRCGDTEQDVQVKLVYDDLTRCLPSSVTLTCTGADAESVEEKLEGHRQLFEQKELHRAIDSLKLQKEVVSSCSLSAEHSSPSPLSQ